MQIVQYKPMNRFTTLHLHLPGSAHTVLAPYWSGVLGLAELRARQCSARGGDLHLRVGDTGLEVAGDSVIVMRGTIHL